MRWMALIALAGFFPEATALAQPLPGDDQPATVFTSPPTNAPPSGYLYNPLDVEGPSDAEIGPAQKHFVMASNTDTLVATEVEDNKTFEAPEKTQLDKHIKIPLVHDVLNDGIPLLGNNQALIFEIQYLNWGAVTGRQVGARRGHYFTITWANHGQKADFTARFQYRQVKSKEVVRTLTQKMPNVSGVTRSYFAVVNKAFLTYGPVCAWRFTILKGDTVVGEARSFVW